MCMEKSPTYQKKSDYTEKLKVIRVSQGNDRTRKSEMGNNVIASSNPKAIFCILLLLDYHYFKAQDVDFVHLRYVYIYIYFNQEVSRAFASRFDIIKEISTLFSFLEPGKHSRREKGWYVCGQWKISLDEIVEVVSVGKSWALNCFIFSPLLILSPVRSLSHPSQYFCFCWPLSGSSLYTHSLGALSICMRPSARLRGAPPPWALTILRTCAFLRQISALSLCAHLPRTPLLHHWFPGPPKLPLCLPTPLGLFFWYSLIPHESLPPWKQALKSLPWPGSLL